MSVNKLTYNGQDYSDEIVVGSGGLDMDHAMVGETLSVDTLTIQLITGDIPRRFLAGNQGPNGFFKTGNGKIYCVRRGAPAPKFVENGPGEFYFGNDLVGRYYLKERKKTTGRNEYLLRFLSAINKLGQSDHPGGMYSGVTFGDVVDEIIGGVVEYTIDEDIAEIPIDKGYLPYARRRANLQQLLMAYGAVVRNAADGSLRITQLSDTITGVFDESRVFMGGEVTDLVPFTAVNLTEHNFLETDEEVEIYNDVIFDTVPLVFPEPYHDLQITGGTIIESGVNHCTFTGEGAVVITGKKYLHVTRIVTAGKPPTGSASDIVKSVTSNTMVGPTNAVAVAQRIFEYLSVKQKIRQEVVFGTERPGDVVGVLNPDTGELVTACLKPMDIVFGYTENRAVAEFLVDYKPSGAAAGFTEHVVLTGSGTWVAPDKNGDGTPYPARLILVGGGDGGGGGNAGVRSAAGTTGQGGPGGDGGDAGQGGLIFEINFTATPGHSYEYSMGVGGIGGTGGMPTEAPGVVPSPGTSGSAGTESTFGNYSSAMGRRYPYGYHEPKSGLTFGADGIAGVAGGAGCSYWAGQPSHGPSVTFNGVTYYPGECGERDNSGSIPAFQGGGGGAAVGSNGGDGGDGEWVYVITTWEPKHGDGGNGANADDGADAANYGQGGGGGHGGGGGGFRVNGLSTGDLGGGNGYGGAGGDGGDGGEGVGIVLY